MGNNFKTAISLLADRDLDYRQIVFRIAHSNPKVLVDAIEQRVFPNLADRKLEDDIIALLHVGKKIDAVKLWRANTGEGLMKAKDAVDAIQAKRVAAHKSEF